MVDDKKEEITEATSNDEKKTDSTKPRKIEISVDTSSMEALVKRLKEKEDEAVRLGAELEKEVRAKADLTKTVEEKTAVAEDLEGKLKLIGQQKFDAKKKIIMEAAKKLIKDEDRLKKIEEGIKEPEDLLATEFMIETLNAAMTEGVEVHQKQLEEEKKKAEEEAAKADAESKAGDNQKAAEKAAEPVGKGGAGQVSLAQQTGKGGRKEYDTHEAMIRDLRRMQHSDDAEVAAEADAILDEIFRKWGRAVRKNYEGKQFIDVGGEAQPSLKEITKKGGEAKPIKKRKGEA